MPKWPTTMPFSTGHGNLPWFFSKLPERSFSSLVSVYVLPPPDDDGLEDFFASSAIFFSICSFSLFFSFWSFVFSFLRSLRTFNLSPRTFSVCFSFSLRAVLVSLISCVFFFYYNLNPLLFLGSSVGCRKPCRSLY